MVSCSLRIHHGVLLVPPLDRGDKGEGAAVARVPRFPPVPGHQVLAPKAVPPAPVVPQTTLAIPCKAQDTATLHLHHDHLDK